MKEADFKYKLLINHELTWQNIDLLSYVIEVDVDVEVFVTYNYIDGRLLPFIQIRDEINNRIYFYLSFKKALNRIENILERDEKNDN